MPVHGTLAGPVLVIAVDGDYTPDELHRVVRTALEDPDKPRPARILLDLSGAASLAGRSDGELAGTAAFFASWGDAVGRVAILVRGDILQDLMRMGTAFAVQDGLRASPFRDRSEALEWLRQEE
ncbi:MAG: STAS/SEC14 domain-containing protein [Gemmatimonadota bacterium]|jgi:hypothetical protein